MKKKVIMILEKDLLYPVLDRRVFKEALTLQNNGYQVHIITWAMRMDGKKYPNYYEMDGIQITRIFQSVVSPDRSNIYKLYPFLILFYKTLKMLRKIKPDYIHCHDAFPLLVSYLGTKFTKSKFIYDSHELNPFREEPKVFLKFFDLSEKIVLSSLDYIITANEVRKEFMQKHFKQKKQYLVLNNYPRLNDKISFTKVNYDISIIKFLYQGGVSSHRGIDNIIIALSSLKDLPFSFEIYGMYQPNKEKYINLVKKYNLENKVKLYDAVPIDVLQKKMEIVDVGVVSILNTSLNNYYCAPNKLYDYMKAGLVVLGPDFSHIKKEIESIGFTCNFEDIDSIKKEFINIIANKDNLFKMKEKSFEFYKTKYNWTAQEDKLLKMYKNLENE